MIPRAQLCQLYLLLLLLAGGLLPEAFANTCGPPSGNYSNSNDDDDHQPQQLVREKRWLPGWLHFMPLGGVVKLVVNFVAPVKFNHKLVRSINGAIGFQANYALPAKIIWPHPESYFKERLLNDYDNGDYVDNSRVQLYRALERIVESWGGNGRGCLLRTICEVAETPLAHNGLIGEVLDVVFTPSENDNLDQEYKIAKLHGEDGLDCSLFYEQCPAGFGILDKISALYNINT